MSSNLRRIAQAMRQGLDLSKQAGKTSAWNMRTLARGLQMLLSYQDELYRLDLRREGVDPSDEEVRLCIQAFDVPESTEWRRRVTRETKYRQTITYHVVELTWREYNRETIQ